LTHPLLFEQHTKRLEFIEKYAEDADTVLENLQPHFDIQLATLAAARTELIRLHRVGKIEDEVLHNLERDLDIEEMGIALQRSSE
jgi:CPA1 family monovalent cation:H+ antiporter